MMGQAEPLMRTSVIDERSDCPSFFSGQPTFMSVLDVYILCTKYTYSARNVLVFGNTRFLELVTYLPQAGEKTME